MKTTKYSLIILMLIVSKIVNAIGLGKITLHSYLNEPLSAQIELLELNDSFFSTLQIDLASSKDFLRANMARPYHLTEMKFQIIKNKQKSYVKVVSEKPLRDPFLDFMIELSWDEGKIVKAYSVLVDLKPEATTATKAPSTVNQENNTPTNNNLLQSEPTMLDALLDQQEKDTVIEELEKHKQKYQTLNKNDQGQVSEDIKINYDNKSNEYIDIREYPPIEITELDSKAAAADKTLISSSKQNNNSNAVNDTNKQKYNESKAITQDNKNNSSKNITNILQSSLNTVAKGNNWVILSTTSIFMSIVLIIGIYIIQKKNRNIESLINKNYNKDENTINTNLYASIMSNYNDDDNADKEENNYLKNLNTNDNSDNHIAKDQDDYVDDLDTNNHSILTKVPDNHKDDLDTDDINNIYEKEHKLSQHESTLDLAKLALETAKEGLEITPKTEFEIKLENKANSLQQITNRSSIADISSYDLSRFEKIIKILNKEEDHEVKIKLELAKEYIEIGDRHSAKETIRNINTTSSPIITEKINKLKKEFIYATK